MQQLSLTNQDMQKALDHLSKLIQLEELESQQQYRSGSANYDSGNYSQYNQNMMEQNFNEIQIPHDRYEQNYLSNNYNDSIQSNSKFPQQISSIDETSYQNQSSLRNQDFQYDLTEFRNRERFLQNENNENQQKFIEQSQTDTEYLEEIKKLVRQSIVTKNSEHENRENQERIANISKQPNQKGRKNSQNSSSSNSSDDKSDYQQQNENKDTVGLDLNFFSSAQKNYTSKDINEISERLFQDGRLREQKNSIKKIEQHFSEAYLKKAQRGQGIMSQQTKKIMEKKIQNGQYEPIYKRWDTLLQEKANKMLEANYKKEIKQRQQEEQQLTFKPEVNLTSSQMVSKRTPDQVVNGLLAWNKKKQDKLFHQQIRQSEKGAEELTFHPKINQSSVHMIGKNETEDVVQRLYKKMQEAQNKIENMKKEEFQSKYTFKPKLNEKSAQIVQEQNFRSNMHLHHHQERSHTPVYRGQSKKIDSHEQTNRPKTPQYYHSYNKSITPILKKKKANQSQLQMQQNDSYSKENRFTPICDSSNGRISQLYESNYLSQKSSANIKRAQPMLEQSLNLTQNEIDKRSYSKDDKILQQTTKHSNNIRYSPQKNFQNQSGLKNLSSSIDSSFDAIHSPDRIYQNNSQNLKKSKYNLKISSNQNTSSKIYENYESVEFEPKMNMRRDESKSPNTRGQMNLNNQSRENKLSSSSNKNRGEDISRLQFQKQENANDCYQTNPNVNVQEIEFNKKLQFLIDLLSAEEKKKYQSNVQI
ncbi:hypothetical protein TTHERM_00449580 (macronuclear) [Tetrahymena thermophila SB210]|uniref:Uncharacterized protein n=1 Tax=Tetrahymena thermophila (strain SB210) TaxID=312017 RepID=Q238W2_TETTS|nr:hypothetical protein TTHERM_00449580 [Tetrahymena thermophila SB210]EAR93108.3 hypothetical protein TTHERM_00449580 [Tetrahymena thermophila SB210]|eukprot:XP_001013353.3 hypothetical protein TTHERM_00449580 [Tetrahymena thermophila SB210]